jgi:hypothetical protein
MTLELVTQSELSYTSFVFYTQKVFNTMTGGKE